MTDTGNAIILTQNPVAVAFDETQTDLIKRTICQGATDDEFLLFLHQAKRTQLDPLTRQIYAVKRWDSKAQRETMTIQISIDGFRLIAERSGKYAGQEGPFWCGEDGQWRDVWIGKVLPAAAKVGVIRSDFSEVLWGVARFDAYSQKKKDGGLTHMWQNMGDVMIAKCAESLALRKAFPHELSGLYTGDEMGQADNDAPKKKEFTLNPGACKKDGSKNPDWKGDLNKEELWQAYNDFVDNFEKSQSEENSDEIRDSEEFAAFRTQAESDWPDLIKGWRGPDGQWNVGVKNAYQLRVEELRQLAETR